MFSKITEMPREKPQKNFNDASVHGKAHHHEMGNDDRTIGNDTTTSKFFVGSVGEKRGMIWPKKGSRRRANPTVLLRSLNF